MRLRHLLGAALGTLLLASCGGMGGEPSAGHPVATKPTPGSAIVITEQSHAVAASVGTRILVFLKARPSMTSWSEVESSDVNVLTPTVIEVMVPHDVTAAAFTAFGPGVALITAGSGPLCQATMPCPMYAALFSVQVTVRVAGP